MKKIKLVNIVMLTIAGIINAIGVACFLASMNLVDSGISGTSVMLARICNSQYLPMSFFLVVLNIPFFLLALSKKGFRFVFYSIYAIIIYSVAALIMQIFILPENFLNHDLLLGALFGGLLSGIGSGLVIRFGGALDGVEAMSVLFAKKIGLSVGTFVFIYNVLLYLVYAAIFKELDTALYSIIAYAIGTVSIDYILDGFDKAKAVNIVTDKADIITEELSKEMERGVTIIDCQGFYASKTKKMIYCVINRFEVARTKEIVKNIDPLAFVTISEVSEVMTSTGTLSRNGIISKKSKKTETITKVKKPVSENKENKKVSQPNEEAVTAETKVETLDIVETKSIK